MPLILEPSRTSVVVGELVTVPIDFNAKSLNLTPHEFVVEAEEETVFTHQAINLVQHSFDVDEATPIDFTAASLDLTPHSFDIVDTIIPFTPASLVLTPHSFDIFADEEIPFTLTSLTLTPHSFEVLGGDIDFTPASLVLTPHSFDVDEATPIDFTGQSIALTPHVFTVDEFTPIDFTAASLVMTPHAFTVEEAGNVDFTPASLVLTPHAFTFPETSDIEFDLASLTLTPNPFTTDGADLTINSIGPQESDGDVPFGYSLPAPEIFEVVMFDDQLADPATTDFGTGATSGYIDLGQMTLTVSGSGIVLDGPDSFFGNAKFAWWNGTDDAPVVSPSVFVEGAPVDFTLASLALTPHAFTVDASEPIDFTAQTIALTEHAFDVEDDVPFALASLTLTPHAFDFEVPASGATDTFDTYTVGQDLAAQADYIDWSEVDGGTGTIQIIAGDSIQMSANDSGDGVEWNGVDPGSDSSYLELDVEIVDQASVNATRIRVGIGDVEFRAIGTGSVQMRQPIGGTVLDSDSVVWTGATQQTLRFERDVANTQCRQLLDGLQETLETGMTFGAGATDRVWKIGIEISDTHNASDIIINEIRTGPLA